MYSLFGACVQTYVRRLELQVNSQPSKIQSKSMKSQIITKGKIISKSKSKPKLRAC